MVRAVVALFVLLGLAASVWLGASPRYRDPNWPSHVAYLDSEAYFRAFEANLTREAGLCDIAIAATSLAFCVLLFVLASGLRTLRDMRAFRTPSTARRIVLLANVAMVGALLSGILEVALAQSRREFPPWADSLGIHIFLMLVSTVLVLVLVNLALRPFVRGKTLPLSLWTPPVGGLTWNLPSIATLTSLGAIVALGYSVMRGSYFSVAPLVLVFYVALCARASSST